MSDEREEVRLFLGHGKRKEKRKKITKQIKNDELWVPQHGNVGGKPFSQDPRPGSVWKGHARRRAKRSGGSAAPPGTSVLNGDVQVPI